MKMTFKFYRKLVHNIIFICICFSYCYLKQEHYPDSHSRVLLQNVAMSENIKYNPMCTTIMKWLRMTDSMLNYYTAIKTI